MELQNNTFAKAMSVSTVSLKNHVTISNNEMKHSCFLRTKSNFDVQKSL
jgi:hypothetical protein